MSVRVSVVVLLLGFSTGPLWADTWTDSTGKFTVEAEYVGFKAGKVGLRRADGKVIAIPLERLSEADQAKVKELMAAAAAPTESDTEPTDPPPSEPVGEHSELVAQVEASARARQTDGFSIGQDGTRTRLTDVVLEVDLVGPPAADALAYGMLKIDSAIGDERRLKFKGVSFKIGNVIKEFEDIDRKYNHLSKKHPPNGCRIPLVFKVAKELPQAVSLAGRIKLRTGGEKVVVEIDDLASHNGAVRDPELKKAGLSVEIRKGGRDNEIIAKVKETSGKLVDCSLVDATGEEVDTISSGSSSSGGSREYHWEARDAMPADARVRFSTRIDLVDISIPLEFADVPMAKSEPDLDDVVEHLQSEQNVSELTLNPVGGQSHQYVGEGKIAGHMHPVKVTVEGTKIKLIAEQIEVTDRSGRTKKVGPWQTWGRWDPFKAQ